MSLTSGNFLSNAGVPVSGNGSNGDHYRDTTNQNLWFKQLGGWTLVGNLNDDAQDGIGTIWLSGTGTPMTGNGANGNYYRDTSNQDLWFKTGGFWTLIGTLLPMAAEGTTILSGAGAPSNGDGSDSQYYRDTDNQNIYLKTSGAWAKIGTWSDLPPGTTILSGSGAPAGGLGVDGDYYLNSINQDVYLRGGGIWVLIGSWAAGAIEPFVVNTWNMTGISSVAEPASTLAAAISGAAPDFEITPTAPLAGGAGPLYISIASSSAGIPRTGTGQVFSKVTMPVSDVGDNLFTISIFIVNSSATELDVVTLANGGTPTNAIWGVSTGLVSPRSGGDTSCTGYIDNVAGAPVVVATGWADSDVAYVGLDYDTGNVVVQKNSGAITQMIPLDLTGCPPGDSLKVMIAMVFYGSSTPVLLDAPVIFSLGTTDGGKTAFTEASDAILPGGSADGDVFEVTGAGRFGGKTTVVGDYVQLYDTRTKIVVTSNPATLSAAVADFGLLDGRTTVLETTVAHQGVNDTLGVRTISSPGTTVLGGSPGPSYIRISVGAANESFNIVADTGKVIRVIVAPKIDYSPGGGDVFTLNGMDFDANTANRWVFEVFDDDVSNITWQRVLKYSGSVPAAETITLADGVASNDFPHCSNFAVVLSTSGLTGNLANWEPYGPNFLNCVNLHSMLRVTCAPGTHGITNLASNGWGLAPGESAIRYPDGFWVKV